MATQHNSTHLVGSLLALLARHGKIALALAAVALLLVCGCAYDKEEDYDHGFPQEVDRIITRNCATTGCHTAASAPAAAGLNLESWDELFLGSRGGSPVIPYATAYSYLLYAVNTDSSQGPVLVPTMPIGMPALSAAEYQTLKSWIEAGARNAKGEERFPPRQDRKKWYVANQGCDRVAVVDAESKQIMRYIEVGVNPNLAERPIAIVMAPDQQSWFVVFSLFSPHIEQYSTLTDEKIASISLGHNGWNSMCISPDGNWGIVVGEQMREVAVLDLTTNRLAGPLVTTFQDVHGPIIHPTQPKLYLPQLWRSGMYVMTYDQAGLLSNPVAIDLVQGVDPVQPGNLWPYEIVFAPDGSRYYVACRHSNEVRVFAASNDSLLQVIQVGDFPVDMALSSATGHLLVACQEDTTLVPASAAQRGSVAVIDLQSGQRLRSIYTGLQPGAVDVDPSSNVAVVANRNVLGNYSSQHHASPCAGINGYVTLIDLQTLQVVADYKPELLVDPVAVAVKR